MRCVPRAGGTISCGLMVDDEYAPPSRRIDAWGLRAEYWVEGVGDDFGVDTTETGTFLLLATDQVRFYPIDSRQVTAHAGGGGYRAPHRRIDNDTPYDATPIDQIPALVFSEIMRDVDLFVGVASVGNDPTWLDGGREVQQGYWSEYAFGDLSTSAHTRKTLLERLIPRLKIADQCSFEDRFLVVKGTKRTYRIHFGSGNILMAPDDEYLCIVPNATALSKATGRVFLPFEGDRTIAIILSKAFLLADDAAITDKTILSQIGT